MKNEPDTERHRAVSNARDFLRRNVISKMGDQSRGEAWLESTDNSQPGLLLMLCIALDIRVCSVTADTYIGIFNDLPLVAADACVDFVAALQKNKHYVSGPLGASLASAALPPDNNEEYVRVLEIGAFAFYYNGPRSHRGMGPDEIGEVRQMYFETPLESHFGDIQEVWSGTNARVWIMPRRDLDEIKASMKTPVGGQHTFPGTPVLDALGLPFVVGYGPNGCPDLVAVHYPSACEGLNPCQPTAIDADWAARWVFYVSYGVVDGWGRTRGLTGKRSCRERVHGPYQPLTSGFRGEHIGEAEPIDILDLDHVLEEAAARYLSFTQGSAGIEREMDMKQ